MKRQYDVRIDDHGTLVLFFLQSNAARAWWKENVQDGMRFGRAYVVEHRYAQDLIHGMLNDAVTVGNANGIGR